MAATNSSLGRRILDAFDSYVPYFKKIIPNDYSKMLSTIAGLEEKGLSRDQAEMEAFYINQKS